MIQKFKRLSDMISLSVSNIIIPSENSTQVASEGVSEKKENLNSNVPHISRIKCPKFHTWRSSLNKSWAVSNVQKWLYIGFEMKLEHQSKRKTEKGQDRHIRCSDSIA